LRYPEGARADWRDRVTTSQDVCYGAACVRAFVTLDVGFARSIGRDGWPRMSKRNGETTPTGSFYRRAAGW
jgi:hypothetical protein